MDDQVGHDDDSTLKIRHARLRPGIWINSWIYTIMEKKGYVYFMTTSLNKVLYVGVTNSLKRRVTEHADGCGSVFTGRYSCNKLVYFESFPDIEQAIAREKQIKHFKREWKNKLVEAVNPDWLDLSQDIVLDPAII